MNLGTLSGGQTAVPVATMKLCPHSLTAGSCAAVFEVWLVILPLRARKTIQSSTPATMNRRCPQRHFGENQLLPSSISFSLQPTAHPMMLRYQLVRTSIRLSADFILAMGSSPGFGFFTHYWSPYSDSLSLRLRPLGLKLTQYAKSRWIILQ